MVPRIVQGATGAWALQAKKPATIVAPPAGRAGFSRQDLLLAETKTDVCKRGLGPRNLRRSHDSDPTAKKETCPSNPRSVTDSLFYGALMTFGRVTDICLTCLARVGVVALAEEAPVGPPIKSGPMFDVGEVYG